MTNGTCLLLIDDGREDYLEQCRASLAANLPAFDAEVLVRDADHLLGFTGAVREGWRRVRETGCEWVVHVESDFLFNEPVELGRIRDVMERHPYLAQMSLKRQPVNSEEKANGDILVARSAEYREVRDGFDVWVEHRAWWTTNPSLYRVSLTDRGWPDVRHSEGVFSARLFASDPRIRSGIWGAKWDPPRVQHIGAARAGHGY